MRIGFRGTLGMLLLMLVSIASAEGTRVNGYEITLFFEGRTADCIKTKDNSTCATYFGEDGSVERYTYAAGQWRSGKWWIDAEERLVVQWEGRTKGLHFDVFDRGDGSWELVKGGKTVSVVAGVQPGNTLPKQ